MSVPTSATDIKNGFRTVSFPSKTWRVDKTTNRITGETDGFEATAQAAEILLNVERYRWQIFRPYSGQEFNRLIGWSASDAGTLLRKYIEEALSTDDRITGIEDYDATVKGDTVTARFTVKTVYGAKESEVTWLT